MDFQLPEEHQAARDLAARILRDHGQPERLAELERGDWLDRTAWQAMAQAGLLAAALPEDVGGGGLGFLGIHVLLEQAGATLAHVPLWETLVAADAVAVGHPDASAELAAVLAGHRLLTVALQDDNAPLGAPTTEARRDGPVWRLDGSKVVVPCAPLADAFVVSATTESGRPGLFLVDVDEVRVTPQPVTSDLPHGRVRLERAAATALSHRADGLQRLLERATAGLASMQAGLCQAALRLTADYTSRREQFGRPIATFQAVSQRVAAAFVDVECVRLTALQAAWRLHEGLPASDEVAIAKFWAAEGGHRVLHACQHVHGGVGVDREYPLHRYLLRTKQHEFALGSAADQLGLLGAALAAEPI